MKKFFKNQKWFLPLSVILVISFLLGIRLVREKEEPPMKLGDLIFSNALNSRQSYAVGDFAVLWNPESGGSLTVFHNNQPDLAQWQTLPGKGFVSGAWGEENFSGSRGSFQIEDSLKYSCVDQTIEQIESDGATLQITGQLRCDSGHEPIGYQFEFAAKTTHQLQFSAVLLSEATNRTFLTYGTAADEHFFGFGMQFSHFDFKGRRVPILVEEQGVGRGNQPLTAVMNLVGNGAGGSWHTSNAVTPFYMTSKFRALFLETFEYVIFDLRQENFVQIKLFSKQLTGRIIYGETPAQLIASYTSITGRMRPLPDWILDGAIVGVQGGTTQVQQIYHRLKEVNTPIAAFWLQDWVGQRDTLGGLGKQLWWNWELDEDHYPEWEGFRQRLAQDGIRLMLYVNPFLVDSSEKSNAGQNLFQEAENRGYLVQNGQGETYLIQNTDFSAGLIDLTNPDAFAWLKTVIQDEMIAIGASGWMADFGEALPLDARLYSGEPATSYHNQYPDDWARLNREAVQESGQEDSLVFFSRAGYRSTPQYATLFWLGDQLVSWDEHDGIKTAVTGLLSGGISGFAFNHSDIGGYTTISVPLLTYERDNELLLRWMELNAFSVIFRSHEGFSPAANSQIYSDAETLSHFSKYAQIYSAWGFYRKALVQEAAETGLPVVRHPFIHYPEDPEFFKMTYQQFMVGSEFMIAPVLDPGIEEVEIYLPAGRWIHLWSQEEYVSENGLYLTVPAPLGEPGVFYQANSEVGEQFAENLIKLGLLSATNR